MRSYGARRGRLSPLTVGRLARLGPARLLSDGAVVDGTATFGRVAPVVLDIGCGHGAAAVAYASAFPEVDVLGIDVYQPGVARMLAAADRASVPNVHAHIGDAVELLESRVLPGVLAQLHVFFPDPWPKAKHAKRRFVSPYTLGLLHSRLRPGGRVLLATDRQDYARYVVAQARSSGLFTAHETARPSWRPVDGFEAKARAADRSVTDLVLDRVARPTDSEASAVGEPGADASLSDLLERATRIELA